MATNKKRATTQQGASTRDNDDDFITMGFRCYRKHARVIEKAAALQRLSNSGYMRLVVLNQASADVGVPAPDYSLVVGSPSLIQEAARKAGLTVSEYTKQAVRARAARDLASDRSTARVVPLVPVDDDEPPRRRGR